MKRIEIALALGLAATATNTHAQDALGPYVGLGVGLHMADSTLFNYQQPPGTQAGGTNANFRLGFGIAASAGYR
jgi:hypothetical protein